MGHPKTTKYIRNLYVAFIEMIENKIDWKLTTFHRNELEHHSNSHLLILAYIRS